MNCDDYHKKYPYVIKGWTCDCLIKVIQSSIIAKKRSLLEAHNGNHIKKVKITVEEI